MPNSTITRRLLEMCIVEAADGLLHEDELVMVLEAVDKVDKVARGTFRASDGTECPLSLSGLANGAHLWRLFHFTIEFDDLTQLTMNGMGKPVSEVLHIV